ncbi:MAG TPA: hypothetical protein VES73_18110, partial [Lamprocystis sp. (in: g-proteobacteria)]|nr:hypothetical protein [Lamprocystis sp. (in: g-proteobacteria)]
MDRKIILSVVSAALIGFFAVLLLMPPTIKDEVVRLPWRVTTDQAGRTQVFGFTLGQTPLGEVRSFFGEDGTINLFKNAGGPAPLGVEVFFEQVYLQSLRADIIV